MMIALTGEWSAGGHGMHYGGSLDSLIRLFRHRAGFDQLLRFAHLNQQDQHENDVEQREDAEGQQALVLRAVLSLKFSKDIKNRG